MADAVVDAVAEKYGLKNNFPLAVCGGSMGGVGALMYAADSKRAVEYYKQPGLLHGQFLPEIRENLHKAINACF